MTSCRADRLSLILAATLLAAAPVYAQQDDQAPDAPVQAAPLPDAPPPPSPAPPKKDGRAVAGVEVQELKAPDPEAVGVLDEKQGGFGPDLWEGSAAATLKRFIPALPTATTSHAQRGLMRRLLLSPATPPKDTSGLLGWRAEALMAMGELDGLNALLKAAPGALMTPQLARLKLDSLLLAGDPGAACGELAAAQAGGPTPELAKAQVFCHLAVGRTLEGNLALDLMRERKDADHGFIAAAEVMGGLPPGKADLSGPLTPVHLAAFKAAKLPLPANAADAASPAALRAIAMSPNAAPELRLLAAEKAEAVGSLDTEALRQLYGAVAYTPAELQAAVQAGNDKTAKTRALLFRAASLEVTPAGRAEAIGRALKHAGERGAFVPVARLYAGLLADMKADPALAAFSPLAARALFAAQKPEAAKAWLAVTPAKEADALWPLARFNDPEDEKPTPPAVIANWRAARPLPPDKAALVLGLLSAVGERVPAAEWLSTLEGPLAAPGGSQPKPALKFMLRASAEGLQVGETVLLALASLGDLDKADADSIVRVVAALRQVGLDKEARALAVEAALANGV